MSTTKLTGRENLTKYLISPILRVPTLISDTDVRFCCISSQRPTEPSILKVKLSKIIDGPIVEFAV
jgi:hypothetical protein